MFNLTSALSFKTKQPGNRNSGYGESLSVFNKNELRQQTRLTRIVFPPIGAWIHDGHGYLRWVEWHLRTELQNRPVNSLEGSMSIQAKFYGPDRRWYMYIHMRSSSGLFHVHTNAKSVNQFPAGKRIFTPPM